MNWNEHFIYEPESGNLIKASRGPGGRYSGSVKSDGKYRDVVVDGKHYLAHRIIWEMHYGDIPDGAVIDHIDGNGLNNRLDNLRLVTKSGNQRNRRMPRNNKIGIMGVYRRPHGYAVRVAGRHLGTFRDFFDACCARLSAEKTMGFHKNHGRSLP